MTLHRMTSLTEPTSIRTPVSAEGGDPHFPESHRIAVLAHFVEFMRFCRVCDREQIFRAGWQVDSGLLGCCLGCGDERVVEWTRTNSEVA